MKTFLSIGSGPGIGLATAERFAEEGYRVILTSRNQGDLTERVATLNAAGYTAEGRYVDAGDLGSIVKLVHDAESQFGSIDVLHFNSAAMHDGTIEKQTIESFVQDLTINIGAGYAAVKEASCGMLARKEGTILLTGGIFATAPNPDYLSLGLGKAGLLNLNNALFDVFRSQGVHIATLTVATLVAPHSQEAKGIAQAFWELHSQAPDSWVAEVVYPSQQ